MFSSFSFHPRRLHHFDAMHFSRTLPQSFRVFFLFQMQGKISAGKLTFSTCFSLFTCAWRFFSLPFFSSFLPSSWHRLSRKNIFHLREHAISESFSLHNDVEVFFFSFLFFLSLRSRRIINGRKLRKLCNIFIKFFVVACNFYEMEKFFLVVCFLRMGNFPERRMEIKIKENFRPWTDRRGVWGVKKFMKRELITSNLDYFFIFIQCSVVEA